MAAVNFIGCGCKSRIARIETQSSGTVFRMNTDSYAEAYRTNASDIVADDRNTAHFSSSTFESERRENSFAACSRAIARVKTCCQFRHWF